MITLEIPEATPSDNATRWAHWCKKAALRKRWAWLVKAAMLEAKVFQAPKYPKAIVTIERHGPRSLDADNARMGAKCLMDSLVAEGLILDDSVAVIGEPVIRQIKSKLKKTVVTIEGL
jgi:hypothetical protein